MLIFNSHFACHRISLQVLPHNFCEYMVDCSVIKHRTPTLMLCHKAICASCVVDCSCSWKFINNVCRRRNVPLNWKTGMLGFLFVWCQMRMKSYQKEVIQYLLVDLIINCCTVFYSSQILCVWFCSDKRHAIQFMTTSPSFIDVIMQNLWFWLLTQGLKAAVICIVGNSER